ncbi:MAG: hypothetical protein QOH01_2601 [Verrucomicrobiota bacterium]
MVEAEDDGAVSGDGGPAVLNGFDLDDEGTVFLPAFGVSEWNSPMRLDSVVATRENESRTPSFRTQANPRTFRTMKICAIGLLACLLLPVSSFAKDSVWVVGNSNKIAISLFEHRTGAQGRAADVTLITGGWSMNGSVKDTGEGYTKPTPITLKTNGGGFKGTISIDFENHKVMLKGTLTLSGEGFQLNEKISFKELQGI